MTKVTSDSKKLYFYDYYGFPFRDSASLRTYFAT